MKESELKRAMQANPPEPPEGFDARSDMLLAGLLNGKETRTRKSALLPVIVAMILMLCTFTALAAGVENVNALLYRIWPEAARALRPLDVAAETDGIRLEMISATLNEEHLLITWSLTDVENDRINEGTACNATILFRDGDGAAAGRLLSCDPENRQAVFACYLEYAHLPERVREELMKESPHLENHLDLIVTGFMNTDSQTVNLGRAGNAKVAEGVPVPEGLFSGVPEGEFVLDPGGSPERMLAEGVLLSGTGWVDGKLHVQLHLLPEAFVEESNGEIVSFAEGIRSRIYLRGEDGREIGISNNNPYGAPKTAWPDEHGGLWMEMIFEVNPEEAEEYEIIGEFTDLRANLETKEEYEWRVTFPTNMIEAKQ